MHSAAVTPALGSAMDRKCSGCREETTSPEPAIPPEAELQSEAHPRCGTQPPIPGRMALNQGAGHTGHPSPDPPTSASARTVPSQ